MVQSSSHKYFVRLPVSTLVSNPLAWDAQFFPGLSLSPPPPKKMPAFGTLECPHGASRRVTGVGHWSTGVG